jgi:hypothetical protein
MKISGLSEHKPEESVRRAKFLGKLRRSAEDYPELQRPEFLMHHACLITGRYQIFKRLPVRQAAYFL